MKRLDNETGLPYRAMDELYFQLSRVDSDGERVIEVNEYDADVMRYL